MATDYDSPWKDALEQFFEAFLALLFPEIHAQIDWSRKPEALDKEFQQVVRQAEVGRRYVDKLFKVWTTAGQERWVLIHIEVQTTPDDEFAERLFVYNYRIFDRYNKPVASLAVLADDDPAWRPQEFRSELFGCETVFRFQPVKLLDFAPHEAVLEASDNPFAHVVLAHPKMRQTHDDPAGRYDWKLRIVRGLYERGFTAQAVQELVRVINWMMDLPRALERIFWQALDNFQKDKGMPYVPSIQRIAHCDGLCKAIEVELKVRFGEEGLKLMPEVREIEDEEKLEAILVALATGASLDAVRPRAPESFLNSGGVDRLRQKPFSNKGVTRYSKEGIDFFCIFAKDRPAIWTITHNDAEEQRAPFPKPKEVPMSTHLTPHPSADTLRAFSSGQLDEATAKTLVAHFEICPPCRVKAASLSGDSFLVRLRAIQDRHATSVPGKPKIRLPPGKHRVEVRKAGFQAFHEELVFQEGIRLLTAHLVISEGILVVKVNQPNPDIFVDGAKIPATWEKDGKAAVIRLAAGETRKVAVTKKGFTTISEEVKVQEGQRHMLTAMLVGQAPKKGPVDDVSAVEYTRTGGWFVHCGSGGRRVVLVYNNIKQHQYFARVYDLSTGEALTPPLKHDEYVPSALFSPDGKRVVTSSWDKTARVWDAATGQALIPPLKHDAGVEHATFSPDSKRVVTASLDKTARVWDAATGETLLPPLKHGSGSFHDSGPWLATFSPDGKRIVTTCSYGGGYGVVQVWDAATGKALTPPLKHDSFVSHARFSPDGKRVVTTIHDRTARMWNTATGQALKPTLKHDDVVLDALFSPDGKRVVTSSWDKTARVWNAATGQALIPPLKHDNKVLYATFSPDGKRVVTASSDNTARVWDAATGQALTPPLKHDRWVNCATFSPDGKRVVTTSTKNTAHLWDAETGEELKIVIISSDAREVQALPLTQEQADLAKQLVQSIQVTPTATEMASGKRLNLLVNGFAKFSSKQLGGQTVNLGEDVLKRLNVTGHPESNGGVNFGLLRDQGRFAWPSVFDQKHNVASAKEKQEIEGCAQELFQQVINAKIDSTWLKNLQGGLEQLRANLKKNFDQVPTAGYLAGMRFLHNFEAALAAVQKGDAMRILDFQQKFAKGGKTVPELVSYLVEKGLQFAPANPGDEPAYVAVHAALASAIPRLPTKEKTQGEQGKK